MDDERSVQVLLERVLTQAGHTVHVVASGEAAFDVLEREGFDLLIADKNLPGVDGLDVVKRARERYPEMRAILITGFPTPETRTQAESLGVRAFLTKPFGIAEILSLCDAALER